MLQHNFTIIPRFLKKTRMPTQIINTTLENGKYVSMVSISCIAEPRIVSIITKSYLLYWKRLISIAKTNSHAKYSLYPHIAVQSINASGHPKSNIEKRSSSRANEERTFFSESANLCVKAIIKSLMSFNGRWSSYRKNIRTIFLILHH